MTSWAETVEWRSLPFQSNLTSSGSILSDEWSFHLGYFDSDFIPTSSNTADWGDRWVTLDNAPYSIASARFSGVWVDTGEVPDGSKGYIWGLNRGASRPEWILLSASNWTFPLPTSDPLNPSPGATWSVTNSNEVILGSVNVGGNHLRTEAAVGQPPLLSGDDWLQLVFSPAERSNPAISAWDADPDGDGQTNLVEFAFGLNPQSPDQVATAFSLDAGFLEFEVRRAERVGVAYFGRVSSDLVTWFEDAASVALIQEGAGFLRYRDRTALGAAEKRFGQVRVALVP